jgi:hypothetical protein
MTCAVRVDTSVQQRTGVRRFVADVMVAGAADRAGDESM